MGRLLGRAFVAVWFLSFAGAGLVAPFTKDDVVNLHAHLSRGLPLLLLDNLRYWSTAYRPLGGLFYVVFYGVFGFHPLPFRIACFALLALNLWLLYRFCQEVTGSEHAAFVAVFLASYHAWFIDLYFSTGTIYDLLCYAFFLGAFLNRGRLWVLCLLYICALNSKEMAVTLPLFLLAYEWKKWRPVVATGIITLVYVIGKLHGPGSLANEPLYHLSISAGRYLDSFHLYLNPFFYTRNFWHDSNTVQLLAVMLAVALWRRSRPMIFAWCWILLAPLPVAFIAHYSAFFWYLPMAGWALYAGELLEPMARRNAALVVAILALVLAPLHVRETRKTRRAFEDFQPPVREITAQMLATTRTLPRGAHVLMVNDPIAPDERYYLLFLTQLLYHDPTIEVDRTPSRAQYDQVFVFRAAAYR